MISFTANWRLSFFFYFLTNSHNVYSIFAAQPAARATLRVLPLPCPAVITCCPALFSIPQIAAARFQRDLFLPARFRLKRMPKNQYGAVSRRNPPQHLA